MLNVCRWVPRSVSSCCLTMPLFTIPSACTGSELRVQGLGFRVRVELLEL